MPIAAAALGRAVSSSGGSYPLAPQVHGRCAGVNASGFGAFIRAVPWSDGAAPSSCCSPSRGFIRRPPRNLALQGGE